MSWKCNLDINETEIIQSAPVVADDILEKLDFDHKGWKYDITYGYSFVGTVSITEDVVKDGELTIKFNAVGGDFFCDNLRLTSLAGCPTTVGGDFCCYNNQLTSLAGCPTTVGGGFDCTYNKLTSLKGCPKKVGDDFDCDDNAVEFTPDDVKAVCDVKKRIFV